MEQRRAPILTNQEAVPAHTPHDLRTYVAPVRLHKWLVLGLALLGLAAGFRIGSGADVSYTSSTEILVGPGLVSSTSPQEPTSMPTEVEIMRSRAVARIARETLGSTEPVDDLRERLTATFTVGSNVLVSTFTDETPEAARDGAEAFADAYLEFKADPLEAQLAQRIARMEARLAALEAEFAELNEQLAAAVQGSIEALEIEAQRTFVQQQIALTLAELHAREAISVDVGTVIARASMPKEPSSGGALTSALYGVAGFVLMLMVGVVVAYVVEIVRDAPRSVAEFENLLGVPVLGQVHDASGRRRRWLGRFRRASGPFLIDGGMNGTLLEDFTRIASVLRHLASGTRSQLLLVTSSLPREGRTSVAANIATSLASSGGPVVLVSSDLHAPRLEQLLGAESSPDIVDVLERRATIEQVLAPTRFERLSLVPGRVVPVAERGALLATDAMSDLLASLRQRAEFVILDSPPLVVSDALILATHVDGIVHVVDMRRAKRRRLADAAAALDRAGGKLAGSVLNRFEPRRIWVGASQYRRDYRQRRKYLSMNGYRSRTAAKPKLPTPPAPAAPIKDRDLAPPPSP